MAYYDERPRYKGLMDMIDGGGAGRSGDRFEGGGLLSLLANELFRPAGYEDRLRQRKNDTGRAVTTVIDELTKRRDRRNLDRVDAYNRAEADRQAAAALMDERYDDTILAPGQGGLRRRLPPTTPPTAGPMPSDYPDMSMPSIPGYTAPTASIVPEVSLEPAPVSPVMGALAPESFSPATEEFKKFIEVQRGIEAELGLPAMNMEQLLGVYRRYREREGL